MQKIYVLKCQQNKYYVGKTSNVDRRFAEHLDGEYGSEWTSYYTPEEIIEIKNMDNDLHEMYKTLEYMKKYGIDNVRGAQWSNRNLTSEQRTALVKLLNPDACFRCGRNGHFAVDCPDRNQSVQCFKCREYGHFANECHRNSNRMQCQRCGRDTHFAKNCYANIDVDGEILPCARCERDTHCADECYAKSHKNGWQLY